MLIKFRFLQKFPHAIYLNKTIVPETAESRFCSLFQQWRIGMATDPTWSAKLTPRDERSASVITSPTTKTWTEVERRNWRAIVSTMDDQIRATIHFKNTRMVKRGIDLAMDHPTIDEITTTLPIKIVHDTVAITDNSTIDIMDTIATIGNVDRMIELGQFNC